jgi:hypothetical protein
MTTLQGLLWHIHHAVQGTLTPSMPVKGFATAPLNLMVEDQGMSITSAWRGGCRNRQIHCSEHENARIHGLNWEPLALMASAPNSNSKQTLHDLLQKTLLVIELPLPCNPNYIPKTLIHLGGRKQ